MSDNFQGEIPKARINLKLDLHTGGAQKKTELPLKSLVAGDFSNGKETAALSGCNKMNINENNFNYVLNEYSLSVNLTVENTLAGDGSDENINLTFRDMKDFTPEQVARQIPRLKAMRSLLRDLKANLLDNQAFRKEVEKILLDPTLSSKLSALEPEQASRKNYLDLQGRQHHSFLFLERTSHRVSRKRAAPLCPLFLSSCVSFFAEYLPERVLSKEN